MARRFARLAAVALGSLLLVGCGESTPRDKLVGKWKGAPQVNESVDQVVDSASGGEQVNPLARGAARFVGGIVAKATMSVEIDLRESGTAFFRGNTEMLGLPPDSDGKWELVSADADSAEIRFDVNGQTLDAKVVFRDADEVTLKAEVNAPPPKPPADGTAPAQPQPADAPPKKQQVSVVLKRSS